MTVSGTYTARTKAYSAAVRAGAQVFRAFKRAGRVNNKRGKEKSPRRRAQGEEPKEKSPRRSAQGEEHREKSPRRRAQGAQHSSSLSPLPAHLSLFPPTSLSLPFSALSSRPPLSSCPPLSLSLSSRWCPSYLGLEQSLNHRLWQLKILRSNAASAAAAAAACRCSRSRRRHFLSLFPSPIARQRRFLARFPMDPCSFFQRFS